LTVVSEKIKGEKLRQIDKPQTLHDDKCWHGFWQIIYIINRQHKQKSLH